MKINLKHFGISIFLFLFSLVILMLQVFPIFTVSGVLDNAYSYCKTENGKNPVPSFFIALVIATLYYIKFGKNDLQIHIFLLFIIAISLYVLYINFYESFFTGTVGLINPRVEHMECRII